MYSRFLLNFNPMNYDALYSIRIGTYKEDVAEIFWEYWFQENFCMIMLKSVLKS